MEECYYVKSDLQPTEFVPDSSFSEQVWCRILDSADEDFLLGVCYCTTTDSSWRQLVNTNVGIAPEWPSVVADCGRPLSPGVGDGGMTASTCCGP